MHLRAPAVGILVGIHGISVEDARQLDLGLDGAILLCFGSKRRPH